MKKFKFKISRIWDEKWRKGLDQYCSLVPVDIKTQIQVAKEFKSGYRPSKLWSSLASKYDLKLSSLSDSGFTFRCRNKDTFKLHEVIEV